MDILKIFLYYFLTYYSFVLFIICPAMSLGLNSDCCLGWRVLKFNLLKSIHIRAVHRGLQHMKD